MPIYLRDLLASVADEPVVFVNSKDSLTFLGRDGIRGIFKPGNKPMPDFREME